MKLVIDIINYEQKIVLDYLKEIFKQSNNLVLLDNFKNKNNKNYKSKLDSLILTSNTYNLLFYQYYSILFNNQKEYIKYSKFYDKYLHLNKSLLHLIFINNKDINNLDNFIKEYLVETFIKDDIKYELININDKEQKEKLIKMIKGK